MVATPPLWPKAIAVLGIIAKNAKAMNERTDFIFSSFWGFRQGRLFFILTYQLSFYTDIKIISVLK